jgi:L-aminopeptidase/D-esterase-like protein
VRDPATGKIAAGARKTADGREFADTEQVLRQRPPAGFAGRNTTLAVVATNAALTKVQARKLAQFGSLALARTIYPVNTMFDGDTVFALSLGAHTADINVLGSAAAEALSAAILRAVKLAKSMGGVPGLA